MKSIQPKQIALVLAAAGAALVVALAQRPALIAVAAQGAPPGAPGALVAPGAGRGGRGGGLPGATPDQNQAVASMNVALASLTAAVTTARNELATATFADVKNEAGINAAVQKLRAAELALAIGRADEFAKLQSGPNKLTPEQVTALIAAGGSLPAGRGGGGAGRGAAVPGGPAPGAGRGN